MAAPSGYGYYKEILIQDANVDGNLTDFPVYVFVDADSDIGGNIEDDTTGHDIRFYDVDTDAEIKYEREFFEVDTGDCNAHFWVKVPFVYASPTGNENKIRIYYGKIGDSDGEDAENVWDANFKMVLHLSESGDGSDDEFKDSTSNANHGTGGYNAGPGSPSETPNQGTGVVGYGQDFTNANDDNIQIADDNSLDITGAITIEAWVKSSGWTGDDCAVISKSTVAEGSWFGSIATKAYELGVLNDTMWFQIGDGTNQDYLTVSVSGDDDGDWRHYAASWDGTQDANNQSFFNNGSETQGGGTDVSAIQTTTERVFLGAEGDGNWGLDGSMDEVRISSTNRSAAWIKFTHANIDEADNELTWGAEQSTGGTAYTITCDAGVYAVTGIAANTLKGSHIDCATGVYAVTGALADVLKGSHIDCDTGSYAVTGATASPLYGRIMHCDTGVYALTGIEMTPTYNENVTVAPAVCSVVMTFRLSTVIAGVIVHGGEIRMFMDLSMN